MNYCQNMVILGLIGLIMPKIIQNISKIWDKVYNNRVIALVHELIVVWPNHWRGGPRKLGPAPVIWQYNM